MWAEMWKNKQQKCVKKKKKCKNRLLLKKVRVKIKWCIVI